MIGAVESLEAALRTLSVADGARMSAEDRTRVVRRIARSLQRSSYLPPGDPVVRAAAVLERHADSPTRSARCAQLCSELTNAVEAARRTRPVVLIVEDEPFTASMLHAALSSGPWRIRMAGSATEAQRAVGEQRVGGPSSSTCSWGTRTAVTCLTGFAMTRARPASPSWS